MRRPPRLSGRRLSGLNFTPGAGLPGAEIFELQRPGQLRSRRFRPLAVSGGRRAARPRDWVTGRGSNVTYRPPLRKAGLFNLCAAFIKMFNKMYHAPADTFTNTFHAEHPWHWNTQYEARKAAEGPGSSRVQVLQDGSLYIDYVTRADAGLYRCIADNGIGPPVVRELVFTLKYEVLREVKKYGMMVGALSAASLLCIAVVIGLTRLIIRKCSEKERRKQKSIKEMLEHLEAYRGAKMEQLRECKDWFRTYRHNQLDNYNARVGKVKEACVGNMMLMQEHYNRRIAKIRDHCDCQIERLRESYNSQMSRIKDYKSN
uniref:Ig-like domain-containing protein n=1 Tax=Macrostomum lignano TaxID=282301 RepID=A0A1I8FG58_9PLAT